MHNLSDLREKIATVIEGNGVLGGTMASGLSYSGIK